MHRGASFFSSPIYMMHSRILALVTHIYVQVHYSPSKSVHTCTTCTSRPLHIFVIGAGIEATVLVVVVDWVAPAYFRYCMVRGLRRPPCTVVVMVEWVAAVG